MDSYEPDTTIGVEGYQEQNESQISENTVNSLGDFQHETSTPAGLPRATHLIRTFRIAAILALSHSLHSLSIPPAAPDINNFAVKNEKEDTTSYIKLATNLINKKYEKKQKRDIWSESEMKNISKLENDDIGKVGEEIINSFCNKANINSNIDGTKTKQIGGGIGDGKINGKTCEIKTAKLGSTGDSFQHELGEVPWRADYMIFLDITPYGRMYITIFENFTEDFYKKSGTDNTIKCTPYFPTKSITWRKQKGAFKLDTTCKINDRNKNNYTFIIDENTTDYSNFKTFVDRIIQ